METYTLAMVLPTASTSAIWAVTRSLWPTPDATHSTSIETTGFSESSWTTMGAGPGASVAAARAPGGQIGVGERRPRDPEGRGQLSRTDGGGETPGHVHCMQGHVHRMQGHVHRMQGHVHRMQGTCTCIHKSTTTSMTGWRARARATKRAGMDLGLQPLRHI